MKIFFRRGWRKGNGTNECAYSKPKVSNNEIGLKVFECRNFNSFFRKVLIYVKSGNVFNFKKF